MGEQNLASFFHKVQAVEESFLVLEEKEQSRALNILQSSVNKLLNFVGEPDAGSSSASGHEKGVSSCGDSRPSKPNKFSNCQDFEVSSGKENQQNSVFKHCKKKTATRVRKKATGGNSSSTISKDINTQRKNSAESLFLSPAVSARISRTVSLQEAENAKTEHKSSFDDEFQELASFDCTYDFNPELQHSASVSRAGGSHMSQCGNKFTGKMLSMSSAAPDVCATSGDASQFAQPMLDVSTSHEDGSHSMSHSHYSSQLLPTSAQDMKNCHLSHTSQYGTTPMIAAARLDTSAEATQYAGGVIDSARDPTQFAGTVIDSSGCPSQYAGGVIDLSGDPSQYAGGVVIDSAGETTQYAVLDSGGGEASQYAAGGVLDMSGGQEVQGCDPSHAQYTGAMIPTAQDVTVCTTSHGQYGGTVLAMSVPESISYSSAHYSHTIMQGINCHPHFDNTVLDMSTAASRQCEATISVPSHPSTQYAGTIFEGATVIGTQAAAAAAACSPFQFRRPVFEPHEAFQRSQELTQSLMHASMLQQQQLYQLHQQTMMSRWRLFVCRCCGETLTHHRSVRPHLLTHGTSPLSCRFCRQRQVNPVALLHHLCGGQYWRQSANLSREMYMCHECGKFFSARRSLKAHFEMEHHIKMPEDIKYTCRFCGLQLSKKSSMFAHFRQHAGARFVCRVCGAILIDFVQYAVHMARHDRRKKRLRLTVQRQISEQNSEKETKQNFNNKCEMCPKSYLSQAALSKHLVKVHNVRRKSKAKGSKKTQKERTCSICNKLFPRVRDLEQHRHIHTADKSLQCGVCKLNFQTSAAFIKHQHTSGHRSGKSRENQHLCSECGKAYFRRQALQRHLRQHQSSKPFSCQYCNYRCSEQDNLRRHAARHFSTQRNFICELCGAAFHAKKTLEMHHSYKHNTERRFKCSECPMTFKARNALSRHSKTHSRTRDHGCWCGAGFNRLYNLRRHMRLVHGSDDALPPLRKVEVLDASQTVKQAASTPPAKKMLLKTRKVKTDCMQREQEAVASAVVIMGGRGGGEDGGPSGDGGGGEDGEERRVERDGITVLQPVTMATLRAQDQVVELDGVDSFANSASNGGGVVVGSGSGSVLHPLSHGPLPTGALPHPHLTMEQSYAMVSATLHHHHHNLHPHDLAPSTSQQPLTATSIASTNGADHPAPHPFPHHPHPALDYSQLPPSLSTVVPYSTPISTTAATTATSVADPGGQPRQDFYSGGAGGGGAMEGMQSQQAAADYTTSPFSFIQNFLLPSVGVANLLDLAHASGAK